jgi:hypothetical protein
MTAVLLCPTNSSFALATVTPYRLHGVLRFAVSGIPGVVAIPRSGDSN